MAPSPSLKIGSPIFKCVYYAYAKIGLKNFEATIIPSLHLVWRSDFEKREGVLDNGFGRST